MTASFRLTGDKELIALLQRYQSNSPQVFGAALYQEAETIMSDSKENYVPVDMGTLKNSGTVEKPKHNGGSITVTLGYGAAAKAYALRQHEELGYHHTVGQAKYLERPVLAAQPQFVASLAARIKSFLISRGR